MSALTITVPHKLGRHDAKTRIQHQLTEYRHKLEKYVDDVSYEWDGFRLNFIVAAWGHVARGYGLVRETDILIEADMPAMLSLAVETMRPKIEKEASLLLA